LEKTEKKKIEARRSTRGKAAPFKPMPYGAAATGGMNLPKDKKSS